MNCPYVVARRLNKAFGAKRVLTDISLEVDAGDVVGVLGKNGAGKTTLLELMLGFTPATSGSVQLFGEESFSLPAAVKARVGFVPQQEELVGQLSGGRYLRVIGSFYCKWDQSFIERLAALWEIDLTERIKTMSVGQRQKLSILTALGHSPDLLILDEPVASLDPVARRQFLEQIIEISAEGRRSVIFSSHIVSDVERLANKIWILKEGRLFWSGELDSLKESIVRVHIRSSTPLPKEFALQNALSIQTQGMFASAIVQAWTPEMEESVRREIDASIETQPLTLEEIFLELHR